MVPLLALCACSGPDDDTTVDPPPQPGELQVGVGFARMPVPLGIGTAGYGGFGVVADPTPFSKIYPGTTRIHQHPDFKALAVSRGEGFELVFLRTDTVGIFQQLRRAVVLELLDRTGKDLDHALVIGATHTHSGPGRVVQGGGVYDLVTDQFFPEFYENVVDAMADAVEEALADLKPGRVGTGFAYTDEAHGDRRCEDGLTYTNGSTPMVAIEQEGELVGLLLAYAVHGTVLGIEDLTLSADVSGGIEEAVEDRFDHAVQVEMFNSWGADMSPSDPGTELQAGATLPDGYLEIARAGQAVADAVEAALPALAWTEEPDLSLRTFRVPIDRTVIGYAEGEFPYEYGGVYCSSTTPEDCDPATFIDDLDQTCVPFTYEYPAPVQTEISAGRLGDLTLITFPGEPGTLLAEQVVADLQARGAGDVAFLGYSQDYIGYSILEDDWWQGGYEASGAIWGPRQGAYLADRAVAAWATEAGAALDGVAPIAREPAEIAPFVIDPYDPYVAPAPVALGTVVTDTLPSYAPTDVVTFTVAGHDPWFGAPTATLVREDGAPVLRPNGQPLDSDGIGFWLDLTTVPTYADDLSATTREFDWHFSMPAAHPVPGAVPALSGTFRLSVALPDGAGGTVIVASSPFVL